MTLYFSRKNEKEVWLSDVLIDAAILSPIPRILFQTKFFLTQKLGTEKSILLKFFERALIYNTTKRGRELTTPPFKTLWL